MFNELEAWFKKIALKKAVDALLDFLADPANHAVAKKYAVDYLRAQAKKTDTLVDDRAADIVAGFLGVK